MKRPLKVSICGSVLFEFALMIVFYRNAMAHIGCEPRVKVIVLKKRY